MTSSSSNVQWRQHVHANGEKYWLNVYTREKRSTRPLNMAHLTEKDLDETGWIARVDPKRGKMFYYNTQTKESTWEEPVALKVRREVRKFMGTSWSEHIHRETRKHFFYNRETKRSQYDMPETLKERPKTSLWTEHFDKDYGEKYYHNESLDILTWEFPPNLAERSTKRIGSWAELVDAASHRTFYYNVKSHAVTWSHPSSPKMRKKSLYSTWAIFKDTSNRIYYRNKMTKENRWLPPHWIAVQDLVSKHFFYLNELSGQTQWYRPGLESYVVLRCMYHVSLKTHSKMLNTGTIVIDDDVVIMRTRRRRRRTTRMMYILTERMRNTPKERQQYSKLSFVQKSQHRYRPRRRHY